MLCFLTWILFSKCEFLSLQRFFLPSTCPFTSVFLLVVHIYKIHLFEERFILLAVVAMKTEKAFSCFHGNH